MYRPRNGFTTRRPSDDHAPCCTSGITALARIFTVLLISCLTTVPVIAQDLVSEITVVCCSSGTQAPAGYTRVNVDLNLGAGGDFIWLCYKKGVGAPITGLAVTLNSGGPPTNAVYTRLNLDLNRNAGGDDIFLWYTKDPACTAIRNVDIQVNNSIPPDGYTLIPVDLNRNAGGADIFVIYEEN